MSIFTVDSIIIKEDIIREIEKGVIKMQDYQKLFDTMMQGYEITVKKALDGEIKSFCYLQKKDKEWGICDKNYQNRLGLSYVLIFFEEKLEKAKLEPLVRRLFQEELKDRTTDSFQGIGQALNNLTYLLAKYQRQEDNALFEQAKHANFDCYCGYEVPKTGEKMQLFDSIEDMIYVAIDLRETKTAIELIEIWKQQQVILTLNHYHTLLYWMKQLEQDDDVLLCRKQILELTKKEKDEWDCCSAYMGYIQALIERKDFEQASELFLQMMPRLPLAKQNWYSFGLGKTVLEGCVDLILCQNVYAEYLWLWVKPYIKRTSGQFPRILYQKAIKAAKQMHSEKLQKRLEEQKRKLDMTLKKLKNEEK